MKVQPLIIEINILFDFRKWKCSNDIERLFFLLMNATVNDGNFDD